MAKNRFILLFFILLVSLLVVSCRPACPIEPCQIRMVHPHGNGEYRGVPIWKKQNMKYGEKMPKKKVEKKNEKDRSKNKN